jgi:hypothetical protein
VRDLPQRCAEVAERRSPEIWHANLSMITCLQNPFRVSSTVSGLQYLASAVHRGPAESKLAGVNLGCQPAPRSDADCKLRWPLRPEANSVRGLPAVP